MPGRSGNSHPRRLVEQRREEHGEHLLLAYGLLVVFLANLLCSELKKCANFFSFLVALPVKTQKYQTSMTFSNVLIF